MSYDTWLPSAVAIARLEAIGYQVSTRSSRIFYEKIGISGSIIVHPQGVDERAVVRLEDRGS